MNHKPVGTQHIVDLIQNHGLKVDQVAKLHDMTRQSVWKRLRSVGLNSRAFVWIDVACAFCDAPLRIRRKLQREDNYCNQECYFADLENPGYKQWRQGSRIARAIVSQYIQIPDGAIVHHKDGNDRNNDVANLALMASQADHIKAHRSRQYIEPLWDGAKV